MIRVYRDVVIIQADDLPISPDRAAELPAEIPVVRSTSYPFHSTE